MLCTEARAGQELMKQQRGITVTARDSRDGQRRSDSAISTWSIALVMWPKASLRNYGKHEVVTANTSLNCCGWSLITAEGTTLMFQEKAGATPRKR